MFICPTINWVSRRAFALWRLISSRIPIERLLGSLRAPMMDALKRAVSHSQTRRSRFFREHDPAGRRSSSILSGLRTAKPETSLIGLWQIVAASLRRRRLRQRSCSWPVMMRGTGWSGLSGPGRILAGQRPGIVRVRSVITARNRSVVGSHDDTVISAAVRVTPRRNVR
jgi:hypothetical protein